MGDEVDVYVLRLDRERNRIALSLKRLQPHRWTLVDEKSELSWRRRMGLSLRQLSEAEWEAWMARSAHLAQEKRAEAAEDEETDTAEPAGEDASDHVEVELPGGQSVEEPAPVGEGFWPSFAEEGQLVRDRMEFFKGRR